VRVPGSFPRRHPGRLERMSALEWNAMVAAYASYYGPMLEAWRVLYLTCAIILGILLFTFQVIQRGLSAYL
jgi:hypothetical protein